MLLSDLSESVRFCVKYFRQNKTASHRSDKCLLKISLIFAVIPARILRESCTFCKTLARFLQKCLGLWRALNKVGRLFRRNAVIRDWQYLSRIVDRLSAIVFVLATTVVSFSFILAAKWGEPELKSQPFYSK